ncbi:hypothetical protein B7494_g589 [Chlorociboria aeruginascens]|nr:hypothetical protein B7494_g589 [Chlorociboria aeruginascens]
MPPTSRGWFEVSQKWRPIQVFHRLQRFATTSEIPQSASATPSLPTVVRLRQYQEECIRAVLSHLDQGHKRLGISLATGSGKTVIFTQLIDRIKPHTDIAHQTLILAHRQELVEQAARHCTNAYPTKSVEIEMGAMHASGAADITVASVRSIISGERMKKFNPKRFKLVLVDEAHHIVAAGYMKTLAYFGLSKPQPSSPALVGVSATMSRFDGLRLGAAIDHIVYHKDYIDMIGDNWLSDVIFTTVQSKADISTVKRGPNGDFQPKGLSRAVNTAEINELTVRSWFVKAKERKSTLAFCADLAHVADLTKTFRESGVDARSVTGGTPKSERSARLDAFKRGEFPVLVNCGVFTEGTDIPNIDCVLLARPTRSRNLLVQMIGRGMRLHPGKKDCHIIDMVASLETGIVTTPTLFGLDPSELVDEANIGHMKLLQDRKGAEEAEDKEAAENLKASPSAGHFFSGEVTFTDYDNIFDLIQDTSWEQHIRAISMHAWVCVAEDRYVLYNSDGSHLKIEKNINYDLSEDYIVTETVAIKGEGTRAPFRKPRQISKAPTFSDAVHAADTYAQKRYPRQFISRTQAWRKKPASEGQIMLLNKLRPQDSQLTTDSLMKGAAADMITKIKHGARGRFANIEAGRRRQDKEKLMIQQNEALKQREQVSVGPLLG